MKKTLSLLLALVMVIGLFPVFADEAKVLTAEEAGAILQGYGAIKGGSDGDLMIDKELKRQDAVVILTRLMGKETDALATQAAPSFEDITIDYYKPFLAFAEANKWVEGKKEKTFGFNDVVTAKEFAAMLLRALGHDTTGENYPKVMELAKELKLFNGATVEENAPIVRGIAFILMNNTLETAPKGEDKALVYKLGYKEEPKPQGFVVTEAKAAGRKAIDVVFSKAVKESTLENISIMDGAKAVSIEKVMVSEDGMNVRLVLKNAAKQDAKYELAVKNVKAADGKETVEKFSATIFMTDQVRPEITGVEVINPKTLLIKASEPINKPTTKGFDSMPEIKIDNVKATAKVYNTYKNEFTVELYKALAPGNYKVEVSGLKDFDGLIAKTEEFDITVVEDKEAPTVVDAKMLSVNRIKVVFNEPITSEGSFKVDRNSVNALNVKKDEDDAKVVILKLTKALDLGAVTEIAVEYRGQRDAVNNSVKDWTKFTFKVDDDTELPVVEEVFAKKIGANPYVVVKFSKNMLETDGKYTIKNAAGVVIGAAKTPVNYANWKDTDGSELRIPANFLNGKDPSTYTIILEEFKDGSVRKNPLVTTTMTFVSLDLKQPQLAPRYQLIDKNGDGFLEARLFFDEDMDSTTLLDLKNYIFTGFKYNGILVPGGKRAYEADVSIKSIDYGSKEVVIEANDKKIDAFGAIEVIGLTDRAGNVIDPAHKIANVNNVKLKVDSSKLYRLDGKYLVDVVFNNQISELYDGAIKLVDEDEKFVSDLKLLSWDSHGVSATYEVLKQDGVTTAAMSAANPAKALKIKHANKDMAIDVFGGKLDTTAPIVAVTDKVKPMILEKVLVDQVNNWDYLMVEQSAATAGKELSTPVFDEEIAVLTGTVTRTSAGAPLSRNLKVHATDATSIAFDTVDKLPVGEYEINITHAMDAAGNVAEISTNLRFKVANINLVSIADIKESDAGQKVILTFDKIIDDAALGAATNIVFTGTKKDDTAAAITVNAAAAAAADKHVLEITLGAVINTYDLKAGSELKIELKPALNLKDNGTGAVISDTYTTIVQ